MEPARLGCKILHGPNIQNFAEVYRLLNKENLSFKFYNTNQLAKSVNQSLNQNMNFSKKIAKLKKIGSNILRHTSAEINYFL